MAKKGELIAAVDFGTRVVRVVITRRTPDGQTRILGYGAAPTRGCIHFGAVQDLNAAIQAFRKAYQAATKMAGTSIYSVYCGIQGPNVESCVSEGKATVENKKIKAEHLEMARENATTAATDMDVRPLSSIMSEEWTVDGVRVADPIGMHGSLLKGRFFFTQLPKFVENNLCACLESQGLAIEEFVFMPLAAASGCLTCEDIQLGAAVVDLGAAAVGIAVYANNGISAATANKWGSGFISNDVAAGLKVTFEEATELVLEYGINQRRIQALTQQQHGREENAKEGAAVPKSPEIKLTRTVTGAPSTVPRSELDDIVFERSAEIADRVCGFLKKNHFLDRLARGIVLTGGGAAIHNQDALFAVKSDLPVRVGVPVGFDDLPESLDLPDWAPVMGIVKYALAHRNAIETGRLLGHNTNGNSLFAYLARLCGKYFIE